jgi:regulator of RNase E activity RraA
MPEGAVLVIYARGVADCATLGDILAKQRRGVGAVTGHTPMDCDLPVGCGGMLVMPGDGVIVISKALVAEVTHDGIAQEGIEALSNYRWKKAVW